MTTMYGYYGEQPILPTFANLRDEAALDAYARMRHRVYERVKLPIRLFNDARLLQFGPDSGEDALVFARDGARLTLVEPNVRAHATIRAYFERFGLAAQLESLHDADVLGFGSTERYDIIDAEGFIYTVQPTIAWLAAFERHLVPGGLAFITYYERHGALIELCLKALYHAARRRDPRDAMAVAGDLYTVKWESIPHTRRFESWVMDVLENPFVRESYFLRAQTLCTQAEDHGLRLFSSWPAYDAPLDVFWHKKAVTRDELAVMREEHLLRSTLSLVTGTKLHLGGPLAQARQLDTLVDDLTAAVDACIDPAGDGELARIVALIEGIVAVVEIATVEAATDARAQALALFASLRAAFSALAAGDVASVYRTTRSDPAFLASWGLPNHLAVLARPT